MSSLKSVSCIHSWYLCSDNDERRISLKITRQSQIHQPGHALAWIPQQHHCDEQKGVRDRSERMLSPVWNQDDPLIDNRGELIDSHVVALKQVPYEGRTGR